MIAQWKKIGELTILIKKYGKWLGSQNFQNPNTGDQEEYILFGQKDWSVVLALTEDLQVLAVKQYKQGCDKITLELPAGISEYVNSQQEGPLEVMRRELLEETGHKARCIYELGSYWIASRNSPTRFHCFLATGCKKVAEPEQNTNEPIELVTIPLQQWINLSIREGKIEEPSAVVATARALPFLLGIFEDKINLSF